ncbi:sugar phosphate nucleotidyltransferase [Micromonospora sp. DT31]|uniref:sugar phosphate nucleotidyltransferase n=1 Tax=Micromonospora sp. DT31 TaxID=3393434 RepID=UPI003CFAD78B
MKVVLFCGGRGQRMRGEDDATPKPMVMIGDRPLLWHVMRYYAHFGFTDFVLCLGYGANAVKDYFLRYDETRSNDFSLVNGRDIRLFSTDITDWNITFIDTGPHSTVGERLMRVREHVADDPMFLANYADTLTDADLSVLVDRFRCASATASLLAVPPVSTHHVVHVAASGAVTGIQPVRDLAQWENGGYFLFRPEIFDVLWSGEDLVPHALDRLIPTGSVLAQRHTGFWRAVDTFKDRAELLDMYQRGTCPWMLWDHRRSAAETRGVLVNG